MKPFNITTNGIIKLLKNLNPYKAQGPDNISPRIFKELDGLPSLTLVLFCGMCFTADFVIVSLKTFHVLVTWQMKKFWTYIKHKRKDNIGISSLMMDGKLFCDLTANRC
jgi:hypothetical protein